MFGFDWNGNGVRDGFDSFMDFMVISEMEKEDEDGEEEENEMVCLGVKSCTVYSGGRKLPSNPTTKINVNGPFERVHIDFDHNY